LVVVFGGFIKKVKIPIKRIIEEGKHE